MSTVEEAVMLIKASQGICAKAGLKLHKIVSNSRDVLQEFPAEERAKCIKDLDLRADTLPIERALGITWCVENDRVIPSQNDQSPCTSLTDSAKIWHTQRV